MQTRKIRSVYLAWIRGSLIFKSTSRMWQAKCLRRQSRLENVGSHAKAQFLCLSGAAAGQSCAGLGTGRRGQLRQEQVASCPAPSARSVQWWLDPKASLQEELTSLHVLVSPKPSWSKTHSYFCPLLSALLFSFVVLLLAQGLLWNLLKPGKLGKVFSILTSVQLSSN